MERSGRMPWARLVSVFRCHSSCHFCIYGSFREAFMWLVPWGNIWGVGVREGAGRGSDISSRVGRRF